MKTIHTRIPAPAFPYAFPHPKETIAFFDIETTGLSPRASSLYLIGAMHYDREQGQWLSTQWFADDYHSEADLLTAFLDFLTPFQALYHFNGATFDIPYLLSKCEKHRITPPEHCLRLMQNAGPHETTPGEGTASVDLLKAIRPLKKKLGLSKANQTALERWLGIDREDKYDGGQLISVYSEYMQKKILRPQEAAELKHLLLLHNHDDLAGMLEVSSILSYYDSLHPAQPPSVQNAIQKDGCLSVSFRLPSPVPKQVSLQHSWAPGKQNGCPLPDAVLSFQGHTGTLTLPLYEGTLKFFFDSYRNYYYLPEEDNAIHKSVAQFVDPAYRRKATASTCYTKKEGTFLPSLSQKQDGWDAPRFYRAYKTAPAFYQLAAPLKEPPAAALTQQLSQYLFSELPCF